LRAAGPRHQEYFIMMRSLWIAKTGLEGQQTSMDVISNNLANVSTNGFKRGRAVFQDLMYQTLRQPGAQVGDATQLPSGLQLGTGARVAATERIHTAGNLNNTGSEMDIAINGRGFLQIELPDGTQAYTRDGALQRDQNGQLTTVSGYVIQPPINVPDNALSLTIGNDGTVSVTQPGAAGVNVQPRSSTPPACRASARTCTWKPTPRARPTCCSRAWTAPVPSCRTTSKPPT
jgi:flagellar basal-body rod protein FlgG